jgi:hypothetical protein
VCGVLGCGTEEFMGGYQHFRGSVDMVVLTLKATILIAAMKTLKYNTEVPDEALGELCLYFYLFIFSL